MPWIGRVSLLYGRIRDYDRAGVRGCFCVDDNDLLRQRDQTEESGGKKKKGGEIGWCNSILEREMRRGGGGERDEREREREREREPLILYYTMIKI